MQRPTYQMICHAVLAGACFLSGALAAELPEGVREAETRRVAAVAKAVRSAVAVFSRDGNGGGSAVVISPDGYALSNFHVTRPIGDSMKCGMADGKLYDAVIVGIDPTGDVALIKLLGRDDFPAATMADSDEVQVGDWCFAVGNPFLLATNFQPTVTYGIVSGTHRYQYPAGTILEYADCIQTDAAINPGNSGGPLFNANGDLIGVNGRGSFEKRGRVNVGLGYAISMNQIKHFLGHLHSGRIVDHATLGATVDSDDAGRVVVSNILETSDAYRRGLRYGDEILSFGGRRIGSVNAFKNVLGIFPRGWRVPLTYQRDGTQVEIEVRLQSVHGREELISIVQQGQVEIPQPKDPRQPEDRRPKDRGPQPQQPANPHQAEEAEIPAEVAAWIKPRRGFANYHFNLLNRDRVWSAYQAAADFSAGTGVWSLAGKLESGDPVEIRLGPEDSSGRWGSKNALLREGQDYAEQLGPEGSGGLLAALHLWRRLAVEGPARFGEVTYLGTLPIGEERLYDALVGTHDVVEAIFLFDRETGQLSALEMYPDRDIDPCELRFLDFKPVGERLVPHRIIVMHGDEVFADIQLETMEFASASQDQT